jgi:hypothetical protein
MFAAAGTAHRPLAMLSAKRLRSTATARSPSLALTAKQMECSLLAWLIMITLTPASRTVLNTALAMPVARWQGGVAQIIGITVARGCGTDHWYHGGKGVWHRSLVSRWQAGVAQIIEIW